MGSSEKEKKEIEEKDNQMMEEYGQLRLENSKSRHNIHLLSIIGEVEGHENLSGNSKATKYDHVLPKLAEIASLSIPTVSLVLGGSHSIGVPLAVASDYSFIVPTGTMMIHPVRMSGMIIGASQTYEYFDMIQDRILSFVSQHSKIGYEKLKRLMHNTEMLTRDLGTVLVGEETVAAGLIDEVGGIKEALETLHKMIDSTTAGLQIF